MFLVANLHILNVFSEGKRQNVMYPLPFVGYKHRFYVQYALYFCFYGIALQWHKKSETPHWAFRFLCFLATYWQQKNGEIKLPTLPF